MASNWKEYKVSDLCELIIDCINKTAPKVDYETPYKMLRTTNVRNGVVDTQNCNYVEEEVFEKWTRRAKVLKGDILLTREAPIGEVGRITVDDNLFLGQRLMQYRADPNKMDSKFLLYSFLSPYLQYQFYMHEGTGSVVSHIRVGDCSKFKIPTPPLVEQKAIAHILGTLDDKIELNRQMNETLEAMAQALFKSWFVDFDPVIDNALLAGKAIPEPLKERAELRQAQLDSGKAKTNSEINDLFPSEFEFTEELGWIPKGWSVGEVGDIVNRLKVKKRYKKSDVISFGEIPVFEQGSNILLGFHNEIADIQADVESPAFIFGDHTCVLNLSLEPFSVSANVIPLVGKNYPTYWVYYAVHGKQSFEEYRRHWMELIIKTTILPTNDAANLYVSHIKHLKEKQMRMLHTSNTLMELRDTLLPKLMSGELRIADAEKLAENI